MPCADSWTDGRDHRAARAWAEAIGRIVLGRRQTFTGFGCGASGSHAGKYFAGTKDGGAAGSRPPRGARDGNCKGSAGAAVSAKVSGDENAGVPGRVHSGTR